MAVELLERDPFLLAFDDLLRQAGEGQGRVVLVSGEAGIGKTVLVERFIARHHARLRVLWGTCEALFTPRPLGPLYDISHQGHAPLRAALERGADRTTLFATVLDELGHDPAHDQVPTVLVTEDIHWADEATLDLIKYLARRIHRTPALLILTYRHDEIGGEHPLRLVLGDLPARDVTRLELEPLSEAAVVLLAERAGRSAEQLYATTGGNPFFLTEVLASNTPGVPTSVRDAVLTRVARLSQGGRGLLELVAVVPNKVEWWALDAVSGDNGKALDECLAAGILQLDNGAVGFRHELARQAVEKALSPTRTRALHAQVLRALLHRDDGQTPLARLVHHAAQAEDRELILRFAPAAARQASAQGAHREAAAYYQTALRFADARETEQRAELLDELCYELYLTGRDGDAIAACNAAIAIWRALNRHEHVGNNLRRLSRLSWHLGRNVEAERYGMAAVELLETLPPNRELAKAYGNMANQCMITNNTASTLVWGSRAIELAERLQDVETLSSALNSIGSVELADGDERGFDKLERSLQIALEHGFEEHVGRTYTNLSVYSMRFRDYQSAHRHIAAGIAYCIDRDLESYISQLTSWRALAALEQGDWEPAGEDAQAALDAPRLAPVDKVHALVALGTVRLRRGDPGVEPLLHEARDLALSAGELERITRVMAARAEEAWLRGDLMQCAAEARIGYELACTHTNPWLLGQFPYWLWRAGAMTDPPSDAALPYALQMAGDWQAAAGAWGKVGCPYEQALALMDGDEAAQRQALEIFERLGARPAAEIVRRQLRSAGVRGLPRGPRPMTQANPHGLTPRQLEILLLVAEGLRNPEIADRLSTTPKTVEHHVSGVLAKLNVRSRTDAVRVAYQLGILPQTAAPSTGKIGK
jgi:DNA-binding CsgD family transcriptional regulator/tetratricopeptide (TPR) repeat protein